MQVRPSDYDESRSKEDCVTDLWVKQVAQALSKKFKVSVRKGASWSADVKKKVLVYGREIYFLTHTEALGLLVHEVAHLSHTVHPEKPQDAMLSKCLQLDHEAVNCLEDKRVEHIMGKAFVGAKEAIGIMNYEAIKNLEITLHEISVLEKQNMSDVNDARQRLGLVNYDDAQDFALARANWKKLPKDQQEIRLMQYRRNAPCLLTQVLLEASRQYYGQKPIKDYWFPEIVKKATVVAKKLKEGKVAEMKSTQEIADFWRTEIMPLVKEYITQEENSTQEESKTGSGHNPTDNPKKEWGETKNDKIRDYIRKKVNKRTGQNLEKHTFGKGITYSELKVLLKDLVQQHGRRLKQVLRDNMFDRQAGNHLSGKLNSKKLYKHRTGNMRLFTRKKESEKKDFAFSVICDTSGSMGAKRMSVLRKSVVVLSEILNSCSVPIGIRGFSYNVTDIKLLEGKIDERAFVNSLGRSSGGTNVIQAYTKSVAELSASSKKNKVHICITDGQFTNEWVSHIQEMMKKNKGIRFYGIGIHADLENTYGRENFTMVQSIDELIPSVIRILRKNIIG